MGSNPYGLCSPVAPTPADLHAQLERDRSAVRQTRTLLAAWPAVRRDLRQLLWSLDNGQAVGVEGLGDAELRGAVETLLRCLPLKETKVRRGARRSCHRLLR